MSATLEAASGSDALAPAPTRRGGPSWFARALRDPVSERRTSDRPWPAGPQLGPRQLDVASGDSVITTTLVRSAPDAVIAKMVVQSDGYQTTYFDKWFDGGSSSDSCGYTDLPGWQGRTNPRHCDAFVDSVPNATR